MLRRSIATGVAAAALVGGLLVGTAGPASANHVRQPACDSLRQTLVAAQTSLNNANANLASAQVAVTNATSNLGNAATQLVQPTFNLLIANENQVGLPTATIAFNTALNNFNAAVNAYVSALTLRVGLQADRDVNQQIVPFIEGVLQLMDDLDFFDCPFDLGDLFFP